MFAHLGASRLAQSNSNNVARDYDDQLISCNRLSAWMLAQWDKLRHAFAPIGADAAEGNAPEKLLSSPRSVTKHVANELFTHIHNHLMCNVEENYLVTHERWGAFLAARCDALKPGETDLFHVASLTHSMAMKIARLGEDRFSMQFYDPNKTAVVCDVPEASRENMSLLTLNRLVGDAAYGRYFREAGRSDDNTVLVNVLPRGVIELTARPKPEARSLSLAFGPASPAVWHEHVLAHICLGVFDDALEVLRSAWEHNELPKDRLQAMLNSNTFHGSTALTLASVRSVTMAAKIGMLHGSSFFSF
jgi:hypothetical protein